MLGPLPWNALVAFEAAARLRSFKRAAEELHVTPAAISQQIRSLEQLLDQSLFERHSRGIEPTAVAVAGLASLQSGFARVNDGVALMRRPSRHDGLNVWMAPSFAAKWLVPRLQRFAALHPGTTLCITAAQELMDASDAATCAAAALREHDVDVAIRFGKGVYPGCRVEKLMPAVALPLCSPSLLERGAHPLRSAADLVHHVLLHDDTPYEGRPDWSTWLAAAGVHGVDARRGIHFNHVSLALDAAAEGQGVVLSIGQLASADIAARRLVVPFRTRVPLDYAYYLISREDDVNAANIEAFRHWLRQEATGEDGGALGALLEPTDHAA